MNQVDKNAKLDYEQTVAYFHALHDVRFKLLAFLPVISGVALLSLHDNGDNGYRIPLAILGGLVTIALTIYDQRNTQIYDRLATRAQFLEWKLGFDVLPKDPKESIGPLHSRPAPHGFFRTKKGRVLIPLIWHDGAVAMLYAASLGGWVYLGSESWLIAASALVLDFAVLVRLAILNDSENGKIKNKIRSMRREAQEAA